MVQQKPKCVQIQWHAKVIDIGVHYCVEKLWNPGKKDHKKLCRFWYAYDLTSYAVASGPTPTKAIEALLGHLRATELIAAEAKARGRKVIRNRLHKEFPEAIQGFRKVLRKWKGRIIKRVNWRRWYTPMK